MKFNIYAMLLLFLITNVCGLNSNFHSDLKYGNNTGNPTKMPAVADLAEENKDQKEFNPQNKNKNELKSMKQLLACPVKQYYQEVQALEGMIVDISNDFKSNMVVTNYSKLESFKI